MKIYSYKSNNLKLRFAAHFELISLWGVKMRFSLMFFCFCFLKHGDLYTQLSTMDRLSRKKTKEVLYLNYTLDQMDLTDENRTVRPTAAEYIRFSSVMFCIEIQIVPTLFFEMTILSPLNCLCTFVKIKWQPYNETLFRNKKKRGINSWKYMDESWMHIFK